jgi:HEAT repeat protein
VVIARVPAGQKQLPPEAARLLPLVPGQAALDLLVSEPDEGRRAVLLLIAEARLPADAAAVVERLPNLDAAVARALVKVVGARAPAFAAAAAAALLEHPDEQLQVAALEALEASDGEVPVPRMLRLLQSPREAIRIGAANVLARLGKPAGFQPVLEALERRKDVSRAEADALGRAMARLDPGRSATLFIEWLKPKKGLLSALSGQKAGEGLRIAAISGMGAHPAPDAVAQLEALSRSLDDETLRRHCLSVLARRRHEGARRG